MKEYNLKSGNILRVHRDEHAESTDNDEDTLLFLVYDHRQFSVKREGFKPSGLSIEPRKLR